MRTISTFLLSFSASLCYPVFAQTDSVALAEQYYQMGMETYDYTHRKQAKDLFVQATLLDPDNAKAHFMAGKSIMLTVYKDHATEHFLKALELDEEVDEEIYFYIGLAYHHSEAFDMAINYYQRHRAKLIRSMNFEKSKKINIVDRKIFECRNARIFEAFPVDVEITNMSENINSEYPEYAPAITADESVMIFTSRRKDNMNADIAEDHEYYEDIFISRKVNNVFQSAENIGPPLNSAYHDASIAISPDGSELFIYSDAGGGDILMSTLSPDGTWTKPKPLPSQINTTYLENSVSVSGDSQTLYFTSDRPGGYGGTDIYVSTKGKNGQWGASKNLGGEINTDMDEDGVFIAANGNYLYFSSEGHAGMGNLDIYRCEKDETGAWGKPVNMGYPINTVENDIYFVLSGDGKHAYYSSVRSVSKGELDIYKIDMSRFEPPQLEQLRMWEPGTAREETMNTASEEKKAHAKIHLSIRVVDQDTKAPLEADVYLFQQGSEEKILPAKTDSLTYGVVFENKENAKYKVHITKEDYIPYTYEIVVIGNDDKRHEIKEEVEISKYKPVISGILNVYFGVDSDVPNGYEDMQYLALMMKRQPGIRVQIAGHTDNSGTEAYNKALSQRRAMAVKNYLVKQGVAADRIDAEGYGMSRPIGDNSNRLGRRLNRRTDFKIIESASPAE